MAPKARLGILAVRSADTLSINDRVAQLRKAGLKDGNDSDVVRSGTIGAVSLVPIPTLVFRPRQVVELHDVKKIWYVG